MKTELIPAAVAVGGAGLMAGFLGVETYRRERLMRSSRVGYVLRFPQSSTAASVTAALELIASLQSRHEVVLGVETTGEGFSHHLYAPEEIARALVLQLAAAIPGLRATPMTARPTPMLPASAVRIAVPLRTLLKLDDVAASSQIMLSGLSDLKPDERVVVRWSLRGAEAPPLSDSQPTSLQAKTELALARQRVGRLGFAASGLILIFGTDQKRARELVAHISSVLRSRRIGSGLVMKPGRVHSGDAMPTTARVRSWISAAELAGVIGWPVGSPRVPKLTLGSSPLLAPSTRIPTTGRVIAASTWPGTDRKLAQPVIGGLSHTICAGPTGVGKSTLIENLVLQDVEAGRGCLLLDGKGGDLVDEITSRLPKGREDIIVLDPGRGGAVPGLRIFGQSGDPQIAADVLVGIIAELFRDSWGPWSAKWMRAGLVTIANAPGTTLADLPALFREDGFRRRLVARLDDPILEGIWASYEAMSVEARALQTSSALGKVEELIGRPVVRSVLTQSAPSVDMSEVLARGQVVLVSISPGQIGTPAARLLGALTIYTLFAAIQARVGIPPEKRHPFFAYIDEPRVLGDIPVPIADLLELSRGLGVGLLLGCQSLQQFNQRVRAAALTNAATIVAFRQNAEDARLLARELGGLTAEELQSLTAYEIIIKTGLGPGDVAPPASGRTLPPPKPTTDPELVRQRSAERYGQDIAEVDADFRKRHQTEPVAQPIGRVRRES